MEHAYSLADMAALDRSAVGPQMATPASVLRTGYHPVVPTGEAAIERFLASLPPGLLFTQYQDRVSSIPSVPTYMLTGRTWVQYRRITSGWGAERDLPWSGDILGLAFMQALPCGLTMDQLHVQISR